MKKGTFFYHLQSEYIRRGWLLISLMAVAMTTMTVFSSCIKDEEKNKECDIEGAWVDEAYADYFYDLKSMKEDPISSTQQIIEFEVRSLFFLPTDIPVYFRLTAGATIQPANGSAQDFTNGPVTYTVTSEDGQWTREYKVKLVESRMPTSSFSFEHVRTVLKRGLFSENAFHEFVEVSNNDTTVCWASGNAGASLIKQNAKAEDHPTYQTANGYKDKGVCMNTQSAGLWGQAAKKPIAAGNLFLGTFIVENALTNTLKTTRFGITYKHNPLRVKGYYKYKPGKEFTNAQMEILKDRVDEADIYGVFYSNKNPDSKSEEPYYLYGDGVSDEQLKQNPQVYKVARVKSLPATDEWKPFEMFFEGKTPDPEELVNGGYNLTVVFSSSKNGATFEGAIGSTLYIDEVEVIYEQ